MENRDRVWWRRFHSGAISATTVIRGEMVRIIDKDKVSHPKDYELFYKEHRETLLRQKPLNTRCKTVLGLFAMVADNYSVYGARRDKARREILGEQDGIAWCDFVWKDWSAG